ncbi:alpha/beta hydrolase family protein [Sphingobium sp. KCTC 72723]|uniref:alpha/beta hydrolase family protein n=1 Tax=Sphingobium sp. KCTC 72723 TaxID=2733867 RepID=UPI00165D828B|nr:alpha/beta fold hydrolase [Sphingobium sp. KCTC 72723]
MIRALATMLALLAAGNGSVAAVAQTISHVDGTLPAGGRWVVEKPADWNGTLLVWSRGYGGGRQEIQIAANGTRDWLLAHGYALAAADYSRPGWAIEEGVPDQIATIDAFVKRFGQPKRTIAWGNSMGGLITMALAERYPERLSAAMPSCGSIGGSVGMMNMALDGAFAFKTLIAPDSAIKLVNIDDDRANGALVQAVVDKAQTSAAGRARIALAAALGGLPGWSDPAAPQPAPDDHAEQQRQEAKSFNRGVFFPRADQERRAGGNFSWNIGIDYEARLKSSGRMEHVQALYKAAGLQLKQDLTTLNKTPRIAALPSAISYMRANYVPTGKLTIPMLSYHEIGDGMTSVSLQHAYVDAVKAADNSAMLRTGWVKAAGHCAFTAAEHIAALQTLEQRLDTGRWSADPAKLNMRAMSSGQGSGRFIAYAATPFPRPCTARMRTCR